MKREFKEGDVVVVLNSEANWGLPELRQESFAELGIFYGYSKGGVAIVAQPGFDGSSERLCFYNEDCIEKIGVL